MTKIVPDIAAQLMANIGSATIVAEIDAALSALDQQREELLEVRKMAVRRHGDTKPTAISVSTHISLVDAEGSDETVASLITRYKEDPASPFHQLQFRTRTHYGHLMRRLEQSIGAETIGALTTARLIEAHGEWAAPGTVSMANSLIVMLRILAAYGASDSTNRACRELKMNLQDLRFERPEQRTQPLTDAQADLIISKANQMGYPSIALAQAFQTDCGLRQKDVIGDWIPVGEPTEGILSDGDLKWVSGLLWDEIDRGWTLRHPPSNGGKIIECSLGPARRVMDQMKFQGFLFEHPHSGPIIIQEGKDVPWRPNEFRRFWRKVANEAGIPKTVKNGA